jgi:hypothetical protein
MPTEQQRGIVALKMYVEDLVVSRPNATGHGAEVAGKRCTVDACIDAAQDVGVGHAAPLMTVIEMAWSTVTTTCPETTPTKARADEFWKTVTPNRSRARAQADSNATQM